MKRVPMKIVCPLCDRPLQDARGVFTCTTRTAKGNACANYGRSFRVPKMVPAEQAEA